MTDSHLQPQTLVWVGGRSLASAGRWTASGHLPCCCPWTRRDPVSVHGRSGPGGNRSLLGSSSQSHNGWNRVSEPRSLVYRLDGRSWWISEGRGQVDIHLRGEERRGEIERQSKKREDRGQRSGERQERAAMLTGSWSSRRGVFKRVEKEKNDYLQFFRAKTAECWIL